MNTRNTGGVASALPASWKGTGHLMEENREDGQGEGSGPLEANSIIAFLLLNKTAFQGDVFLYGRGPAAAVRVRLLVGAKSHLSTTTFPREMYSRPFKSQTGVGFNSALMDIKMGASVFGDENGNGKAGQPINLTDVLPRTPNARTRCRGQAEAEESLVAFDASFLDHTGYHVATQPEVSAFGTPIDRSPRRLRPRRPRSKASDVSAEAKDVLPRNSQVTNRAYYCVGDAPQSE
ncbi:hypothetical protein EVAR_17638_1 [Eumeta japonica]|uniref:Uncharacterized protein n=1 Tax=Eumeta variegata TaxID=151549 RepID=A0A4C1UTF5_EUMVA|nr:hypothetical protein EVAR_17638_1 [Eumeta japonica]